MKRQIKKIDWYSFWYLSVTVLLVLWFFQIRSSCEGIGCLAAVVPILVFIILSGMEFVVGLVLLFNKKISSILRWAVFFISGLVSLLSLGLWLFSYI